MRIAWYIYIPLSLIVTFLTLYLCVKDKDTITAPSPEIITQSVRIWKEENPIIRNTKPHNNSAAPKKTTTSNPTSEPPNTKPQSTLNPKSKAKSNPTPIGKIPTISPALNSLVKQDLNTRQLTSYAQQMIKRNKPQLARIAYERVIDCAKDATAEDQNAAASAIATLLSKTPLWNPDPTTRKTLTINLSLSNSFRSKSDEIITQLEQLIFKASDGTVTPNIKLTSSSETTAITTLDLGEGTPLVTFTLQTNADVETKIPAAIYYSVSTRNNQSQKLTFIPPRPQHISATEALQTYITRLAWVNAAQ